LPIPRKLKIFTKPFSGVVFRGVLARETRWTEGFSP
jgi:hypothetical protein